MDPTALDELITANHILAREDVVDDFGHVSLREPGAHGHFWLTRAVPPAAARRADLLRFDLDGRPEDPTARIYSETILHARIFAARPDVACIIHHHARPLLPFTLPGAPRLRPVFHTGAIMGWEVPVWDSATEFGPTGMLVDTPAKAESLARGLGAHATCLLRSHGAVVTGPSLRQAVAVALYMVENASVALAAGAPHHPVPPLDPAEVAHTARALLTPATLERIWLGRIARLPATAA